jgi:archaellum component FlaC
MTELDEDKIELLERQLAERVTERVRPALFKLYATLGAAVIGVLGFVGWDVVTDIKAEIKSDIINEIDAEIGAKRQEILERTTETQILAKRANAIIQRVEKQLDEFEPKAENLNETIDKVKSLNVASQDFTAIYSQELVPLVSNVEALSSQLSVLAEQVDELNKIVARVGEMEVAQTTVALSEETSPAEDDQPEPAPPPEEVVEVVQQSEQRSMAIQSVISEAKVAEQRLLDARKKPTVFFQFAGGSRDQAVALSDSLQKQGYTIPGEDRERYASGKHEVRFFHDDDKAAAMGLAEDTSRALQVLGYVDMPDVTAESFVAYSGKKPRVGVLELWLDIP